MMSYPSATPGNSHSSVNQQSDPDRYALHLIEACDRSAQVEDIFQRLLPLLGESELRCGDPSNLTGVKLGKYRLDLFGGSKTEITSGHWHFFESSMGVLRDVWESKLVLSAQSGGNVIDRLSMPSRLAPRRSHEHTRCRRIHRRD